MKKNNRGFSIVEIIVVVAIMAILAAVLSPMLIKNIEKSREKRAIKNAREILTVATEAIVSVGEGGRIDNDKSAWTYIMTTAGANDEISLEEFVQRYDMEIGRLVVKDGKYVVVYTNDAYEVCKASEYKEPKELGFIAAADVPEGYTVNDEGEIVPAVSDDEGAEIASNNDSTSTTENYVYDSTLNAGSDEETMPQDTTGYTPASVEASVPITSPTQLGDYANNPELFDINEDNVVETTTEAVANQYPEDDTSTVDSAIANGSAADIEKYVTGMGYTYKGFKKVNDKSAHLDDYCKTFMDADALNANQVDILVVYVSDKDKSGNMNTLQFLIYKSHSAGFKVYAYRESVVGTKKNGNGVGNMTFDTSDIGSGSTWTLVQ